MKFLKLTDRYGEPSYRVVDSITSVGVDKGIDGKVMSVVANGDDYGFVVETPKQIFELIYRATGNLVTWYSAAPDADVDVADTEIEAYKQKLALDQAYKQKLALDQAYAFGFEEAFKSERYNEALADAYEQGRRRVAHLVDKVLDDQVRKMTP